MRKWRNMLQIKEKTKISGKELNETKTSNQPDKEFKVMIIKMLTEFRSVNEHKENIKILIENIKKNQSELKNAITEMKKNTTRSQQKIR